MFNRKYRIEELESQLNVVREQRDALRAFLKEPEVARFVHSQQFSITAISDYWKGMGPRHAEEVFGEAANVVLGDDD